MTLLKAVTEKAFQASIIQLLKLKNILHFHDNDSRRNNAGLPDLIVIKNDTIFLWELKSEKGKLRPSQEVWLDALSKVKKVDVRVLRPNDWQQIEEALK